MSVATTRLFAETVIGMRLAQISATKTRKSIAVITSDERRLVSGVVGCDLARVESVARGLSRSVREQAAELYEQTDREGIAVVSVLDSAYPARLRELAQPPALLFCRGDVKLLSVLADERFVVGIVGTRQASNYGVRVAAQIAGEITARAGVVVSGLALGIDGAAHSGAVEAVRASARGRLCSGVAVLGGGLNRFYPPRHRRLAEALVESGGVIVSEYLPEASPVATSFLERNRIIAALSDVVVVVEAPRRSGALSTAAYALEVGREVMAVPGQIDALNSAGSNDLLRRGAVVVTSVDDIVEQNSVLSCRLLMPAPAERGAGGNGGGDRGTDELSRRLVELINRAGAADFDSLVRGVAHAPEVVRGSLMGLELRGEVFVHPGDRYSIREFVDTL